MALKPLSPSADAGPHWRGKPASPTPPTVASAWGWRRLLDAPHRLCFAAGALQMALAAVWWAALLGVRTTSGDTTLWSLSPSLAHAMLFSWAFMPLFIVGFLFTAGPRWLQSPEVPANALAPAVMLHTSGTWCMVIGFHSTSTLVMAGQLIMVLAWFDVCRRYFRTWKLGRAQDKIHATFILLACLAGLVGLILGLLGVGSQNDALVRSGIHVGLWCCIATVFAAVSHRMIPFFTASALPVLDAWRPQWLLWALVGALWWIGVGQVLDLWVWPQSAAWRATQAGVESVAAATFLWLAIRWGLVQSLKIRLLAMLHGGFAWLGLGMTMLAAHHGWMALHGESSPWGLAPLHALTMGYLGATLVAMATRVAAGHSGRPLAADNIAWTLYWTVQAAVVLRLAAVLSAHGSTVLLLTAIVLWTVALSGWAVRYGRWFVQPRKDGKPG